jgi:NitT/TauT family transport system ATP-binding protein
MTVVVEARDVTVEFPLPRKGVAITAVWEFSLSIRENEFVTIIGPSGCGKTTILNVLAGLQSPTSGEVLVNGRATVGPGSERMVVFQEYGLLPWRTVAKNVAFGPEVAGEQGERLEQRVAEALRTVGLEGFEQAYPYELSGGMRQRVGLARALVMDPQTLLLDEPFGALDAMTREVMQKELEQILLQTDKTVLLITHSIDEAIMLSDRIVVCTARPARIKDIVTVDLPRPRAQSMIDGATDIKSDPQYVKIRETIAQLIQPEIHDDRELSNVVEP